MAKIQGLQYTALYERLSKDDDLKGESNSISNQKKYLEDFARKNGFTNIKHYTDDGFTGTNFNRPGFQEMIDDVEAGNISTIIVKDMSRFGRNYLQVGFYTEMMFPKKGVRFIAINNSVDSDNPMDNDFTPFLNIMNEWYAKDTSNKIKAVFNSRMNEGLRCSGSIPYGYNRLPNDKQTLVVDPVASEIVKRIFNMAAEGVSLTEIARTLENDKVLIPAAYTAEYHPEQNNARSFKDPYRWRYGTINDILSRKEYLGHTVLKKSECNNFKLKNRKNVPEDERLLFENTHEPIIDQKTWDKVRKIRERNRHVKRPPGTHTQGHLLSGYMFCSDCGSRMRIAVSGAKRGNAYYYFRCGRYAGDRRKCSSHNIGEKAIESLLLETIKRIFRRVEIDEKAFAEELKLQHEVQQEEIPNMDRITLTKAEKRYKEVDSLIKGLYENFVSGNLQERQYKSLMLQYDEEQCQLEKQITELSERMNTQEKTLVSIEQFIDLIRQYKNPSELDSDMISELVDKIIVYPPEGNGAARTQKVAIYFNFVGEINLSYTEEELQTIKDQEYAKAEERKKKDRERGQTFRDKRKAERLEANEGHMYPKRICEYCGEEFWPTSSRQIFCNKDCQYQNNREKILAKRCEEKGEHTFRQKKCIVCGEMFWPSSGQEVMCSPECKKKHRKEYQREYYAKSKHNKEHTKLNDKCINDDNKSD